MRTARAVVAATLLALVACSGTSGEPFPPDPTAAGGSRPFAYTTPTPAPVPSPLDGTYGRTITAEQLGPSGHCVRCPPYRLAEGDERLTFSRGVFTIDQAGGHLTVGHFEVSGDRMTLFNDPNCPTARGTYAWRIEGGTLTLTPVRDDCAFGDLRPRYLTVRSWDILT